jgi:hypothetical protein
MPQRKPDIEHGYGCGFSGPSEKSVSDSAAVPQNNRVQHYEMIPVRNP